MKNLFLSLMLMICATAYSVGVQCSEMHGKPSYHVNEYVWDFAVDGGATTAAISLSGKDGAHALPLNSTIDKVTAWVETAAAGASGTYSVGNAASTTAYMSSVAVATLVKDYVVSPAVVPYAVSAANKQDIQLNIGTTAATAGKIHVYVGYFY